MSHEAREHERELRRLAMSGRLSRRALVRRGALLGLSAPTLASLLAACGGGDSSSAPTATTAPSSSGGAPTPTRVAATGTGATPSPSGGGSSATPSAASPTTRQTAPAVGKRGGKLVTAIEADPITMDPAFTSGLPGRRIGRAIFDPLVELDEQGQLTPGLAESWEQPDAKTYVLHLRKGVKFHDGTDFNAEAVKFHFDRHLNPNTKSLRRGELLAVEKVDAVDANTVRISLSAPFSPFLYALFDWSGFIASPTAVQNLGQDFGLKPVGTGPFKFVEYQKDNQTVVERNPSYWDPNRPYLDQIIFRPIPVDTNRLNELRSGGVQISEDLPYQDVQRMKTMSEIVLSEKQGFRFEFLAFQVQNDPYGRNKMLRQALNWALDREAIHKSVYFETGMIGYDPFLPGSPYFDASYQPFKRDVTKAKQLIEQSGLSSPEFTIWVGPDPVAQKTAQIIQANYGDVGVKVNLQNEDATSLTKRMVDSNFVLYVGRWWGYRPDPDQYLSTLVSSQGSNNYSKYANPEIDRLLEAARAESATDKRRALYRQLSPILNEDAANVYYHNGSNFKGLSPKVKGFVHMQDSIVRYRDIWME